MRHHFDKIVFLIIVIYFAAPYVNKIPTHSIKIKETAKVPLIVSSETSATYAGTATVNAPPQKPVIKRPV